ncbi:ATP-binding protein [Leptolyngbya sp. FACHB-671]|uniref:ATP-binding protein n=1 Tax=Leptolyngbya sp. FACHB-671 TaxID=2692812 RepID=UPI001687F092|nr:ATP-binding protein [Leptolyngbya sp. FACHB-671]MBD2070282.1 ATP-binding protein [Leptolyngbya sp. FACHB-671]
MANVDRPLSEDLLLSSNSEKLEYFRKKVFAPHRNINNALKQLLECVVEPAGTSLFLVFGCTGSGKSTLQHQLHKRLNEQFKAEVLSNPRRIIVAGTEVREEPGKFNYKDYYIRGLEALSEVLIQYKILYPSLIGENSKPISDTSNGDSAAYRRALEKALKNRELIAFTLDEAQHLLMAAGAAQMLRQFNWMKSIANLSETTHVLFGTYELLNCRTWNGQTGRRSEDIHLARYLPDKKEDYTELIRVIPTFLRHMPLHEESDLEKHYDYLCEYCLGCVGVLKDWLHRSLRIALNDNAKTLLVKHLKKGELSVTRRNQIREEAERGEQILRNESLGERKPAANPSDSEQPQSNKSKQGNPRPGQRKPKRDPVGESEQSSTAQS